MKENLKHFFLPNEFRSSDSYISAKVGGGSKKDNWGKDRNSHGNKILYEFSESLKDQHILAKNFYNPEDIGNIIEIEVEPDFESVLSSLESKKQGIELLSLRKDKDTNYNSLIYSNKLLTTPS